MADVIQWCWHFSRHHILSAHSCCSSCDHGLITQLASLCKLLKLYSNLYCNRITSLDSFSRALGNKCHSPFYYSALRWINQCHIYNYEWPAPGSARAGMPTSAMGQKLVSKVWSGAPSYQSGLAALERQNSVTSKMAWTAGIRSARTYLHRYPSDFQVTA
jgi:hypothetical protein